MTANIWWIVKAIQDIMRKDPWVDGDAQRIGQISWLLFLKIYDDKEREFELMIDGYTSPIPEEYKWRNWAGNDEGITGDELLEFINEKLFKALKWLKWDSKNPMSYIVKGIFEDSFNYMKSGVLIRQVVNKINQIDFTKKAELHIFNDIYEKVLKDLQSAWNAGEYYTPRAVTQFIVDMTAPTLEDKVLDPSCGTGGFLTCAIKYKRAHHVKTPQDETILQNSTYGTELKQLPHLLATTNLILHGIECPINLRHDDSLSRPIKDYEDKDMVDVVVSNPPFWGQVAPWISHNFPAQFQTQETANLFLVLILTLLRHNGRAWVVLPDGFLFWEGITTRIKEKLLSECNLHTIVRLPKWVFNPYTSISTNLLFFTKWEPTKEIWYFEHPIPEGIKNYSMSNPMKIEEFDLEKAWWYNRVENEYAYKVGIEDIKAKHYNLDIKNPYEEGLSQVNPLELVDKYHSEDTKLTEMAWKIYELISSFPNQDKYNLLIKNLPLIIRNKRGMEQLKKIILTLAIQGNLTKQDINDHSAQLLIEELKQKAYKGNSKRKRDVDFWIKEESIPFNLPTGWVWAKTSMLCDITTWRKDANEWTENWEYPFFTCALEPIKSSSYSFDWDCIILPWNGANVGKSIFYSWKFEAYQRTYVLDSIKINPLYLDYCFKATWNERLWKQYWSAINYIKIGNITEFLIPVPPIKEQKEIIEIIQRLMIYHKELQEQSESFLDSLERMIDVTLFEICN